MRLLLTGGTGFFGKALLRHWHHQQASGLAIPDVCILSRDPAKFKASHPSLAQAGWLRVFQADVCESNSLPQGEAFTHVLHAAADSTIGPKLKPLEQFDQIVQGTRNMLEFSLRVGAQRFLLTSSGGVYGAQPPDIEQIPEHCHSIPDPLNPAQAYSIGKRMAEHLCALYLQAQGLPIVVARCFAFVGPDLPLNVHFAIGNFIRDALWAEDVTVNGDGTPLRSYLDQRDLANWLLKLMMDGESGEAYNVGSDEVVSISELAFMVRDLISPQKSVRILGAPQPSTDRNRYVPDISKIYKHLGLRPTFSLKQSILDTAEVATKRGKEACLGV
jgi:dTDP-glucose 4,6-dehydratase